MPTWDSLANEYRNFPHWEARVLGRHAISRRGKIVGWARWAAKHSASFGYTEGSERSAWLAEPKGHLPVDTDCSGFATWCYWKDAPDPNGYDYKAVGFTGTLVTHAHTVTTDVAKARPADLICIGYDPAIDAPAHVVVCLVAGRNPLVASHGTPGVAVQRLSIDPRQPKQVCTSL